MSGKPYWCSSVGHEGSVKEVGFGLVVTGDRVYRGEIEDRVTPLVKSVLEERGHKLLARLIAPNNIYLIMHAVLTLVVRDDIDAVIVSGGTGPRPRDISVDAVERIADRRLPGFGEEFRRRSLESTGMRAILSRAEAFIVNRRPVFVIPGSPDATRTALGIILDIIGHLVYEARRE
ncbi:MogA/MoaB family molybdenum cofactor biosynthesis protein [Pyrolobus fumarii]|uniref:MogA/MoaB family molybdenum cofactor biosynthesis protein n=1 Tax=Pyrolobus fumarii TaxID=54252 RepID=UPI001ADF1051|nr:MogA/MoaB family molybdenum cofactor biosynthesis protein [Pyrolobus fumarii]